LTAYGWIEDLTPLFDVAHDCALLGFSPTSISVSHLGCRCLCLRLYFFFWQTVCADAAYLDADTAFTAAANYVILF